MLEQSQSAPVGDVPKSPVAPEPESPARSAPVPATGHTRPSGEAALLVEVQRGLARPGVREAAKGLSRFGEHGVGWIALGLVGAAVDRPRRGQWLSAAAGTVGAHAVSIAVKRTVRRPRPEHPDIEVGVTTPGRLSFPSSHATSTTAAAVLYSGLVGRNLVPVLVPPMLASRLVLGVHYPTDVLAGAALGSAVGGVLRRKLTLGKRNRR